MVSVLYDSYFCVSEVAQPVRPIFNLVISIKNNGGQIHLNFVTVSRFP